MKYVLLIIFTLFSLTVSAAPRDVVFTIEDNNNTGFPDRMYTIYEVGTPNILIADNLTTTTYAITLPDGVGTRQYTATAFWIDPTGTRQESDAALPVSVHFRPNAPGLIVR